METLKTEWRVFQVIEAQTIASGRVPFELRIKGAGRWGMVRQNNCLSRKRLGKLSIDERTALDMSVD
jgi:hypothetical protein